MACLLDLQIPTKYFVMLKSYLLTAYRSISRNKEYSLINIVGLAVSIASCLVLYSIIQYELSFDTFHENRERIYRITNAVMLPEGTDYGSGIPAPLPDAVRLDFPQLQEVATIFSIPGSQIDVPNGHEGEVNFREESGVFFAEPQFFHIFSFGWLMGSPEALLEPNTAVLTQETAEKYFGDWKNAIGKYIEYRNTNVLKITGILKNIPPGSDFPLKVVMSFKTRAPETSSWGSINSRRQCYILLDEHTSASQIQNLMPAFEKKHHPEDQNIRDHYILQPLKDVHFDARYGNFNNRTVSKTTLLSLGAIGILLIITASINFVNLAIAQLMKRTKEIGVRKVLGSNRWQLSGQFFGETLLIVVIASLLAMVLTQAVFPSVRSLLNLPMSFHAVSPSQTILFLVIIILVTTAFSGFYPARVLGALKPVQALKSKVGRQTVGGSSLRKSLVVVQFAIAQVLVIATLIVFQQLDFFHSVPLGFDKDSIVLFSIPTDSSSRTRIESFRNRLLQEPEIKNVTFSFAPPLSGSNRKLGFQFNNAGDDAPFEVNVKYADVAYFSTYNLPLVAGRLYQSSDTAREYVVNETFLKKFGIQNPEEGLGKTITMNGVSLPIVGVLKDFHLLSLQEKIEPLAMKCGKAEYRNAGVKLLGGNLKGASQKIEKAYRAFFPGTIFEYRFFDENLAKQYADEERLSSITRTFSGIAILISSLGLYGLISFMAVQRTKEVGVRKVLGASVFDILLLFYKEFILLVLIAFIISAPSTAYFMSDWLNSFAYKTSLSPWIFVSAIALTVVISLATISFQSVKAALANPVNSLRSE
jgi:putative ABC transport system permease protein